MVICEPLYTGMSMCPESLEIEDDNCSYILNIRLTPFRNSDIVPSFQFHDGSIEVAIHHQNI